MSMTSLLHGGTPNMSVNIDTTIPPATAVLHGRPAPLPDALLRDIAEGVAAGWPSHTVEVTDEVPVADLRRGARALRPSTRRG